MSALRYAILDGKLSLTAPDRVNRVHSFEGFSQVANASATHTHLPGCGLLIEVKLASGAGAILHSKKERPMLAEAIVTRPRLIRVWDSGVRIFHWLLVAGIALAFLSSEEESALAEWHIPIGWIAALLIVFRLVWGFVGGEHARFANFVRPSLIGEHVRCLLSGKAEASIGHNPLGALAVMALLALAALTVATGITGGEDVHEAIAYGLLALVGVHVLAVLVMSHLSKENLIFAMVTGKKHADRYADAHDAAAPAAISAPLAAIAVGAAVYGALQVDPQAFTPHAAEAGEHGGEDGQGAYPYEGNDD
jgi:cytochrome b